MSKSRNTLLNYFTKTPPSCSKQSPSSSSSSSQSEKKKNSRSKDPPSTPTSTHAKKSPSSKSLTPVKPKEASSRLPLGELVWAKVEGYPWWPGIVCDDPDSNSCYKNGSNSQIHVHFFDDPPSRAWVKATFVKKFSSSSDSFIPRNFNAKWRKACEQADKAAELILEDRLMLVTDYPSSEKSNGSDLEMLPDENESSSDDDDEIPKKKTTESNGKRKKDSKENGTSKKRRKIIIDSDSDASDEYKPKAEEVSSDSEESSGVKSEEEQEEEEDDETPVKVTRKRKLENNSASKPKLSSSINSTPLNNKIKTKLSEFASPSSPKVPANNITKVETKEQSWPHLTYDFLKEENIKDAKGRNKQHPDYDPTTLNVPDSFMKNLSPAMRQWWELKSQHYGIVLFFKLGKFYELYHMDAVIGVNELGLMFMKGEFAHSGFPEISYGRYAASLIQKGYKVARVEQTETPQMMEERCKKMGRPTKYDKVVKRELCRITTKGTRTNNFLDGDMFDAESCYFLVFTEKFLDVSNCSTYGVCFVDTSVGKFFIGQFEDDCHHSRFRTMISHYTPSQILFDKGSATPESLLIVKNVNGILMDGLPSKHKCWNESLKNLVEKGYFTINGKVKWPETIAGMLKESDSIGRSSRDEYTLAIKAFCACVWYLSECQMEQDVLTLRNFEEYKPIDKCATLTTTEKFPTHMVLDGVTLNNLDIINSENTNALDGTLLQKLDHCCSAFGKRLFRQWLCSPLCNPVAINERLDAIDDLLSNKAIASEAKEALKTIPDLERLLSRIHTQGLKKLKSHPDNRAIFYEEDTYSRRKVEALLSSLAGFKSCVDIVNLFSSTASSLKSRLLKQCVTFEYKEGKFPDLQEQLDFFDNAFDHARAKKEGKVTPAKNVNEDYDEAISEIKKLNNAFQEYLDKQCKHFGCKVSYLHSGRNRFQLEIPDSAAKNVSSKYELQSQRKGFKRYLTSHIQELLAELVNAEEQRDAALKDTLRHIFASFDKHNAKWQAATDCMAVLDVLLNLAENSSGDEHVRPCFVKSQQPYLDIRSGSHPVFAGDQFIPNDTVIGFNEDAVTDDYECPTNGTVILVTGPNMGGKSTLMRQIGLIVIMAHMGCYVPAQKCHLTPVDRVFTRVGARDRIMSGESTLFVELSETASILQHATKHSLVLMDELGRGTATFDGTAVANSVVRHLSANVKCRTFFSTHYHSLVDEFSSHPVIALGHMACMVEEQNDDDPTLETVTFLYKFITGACPKSYGFNTAKLANVPNEIIRNGYQKAKELETTTDLWKSFRSLVLMKEPSIESAKKILGL